MCVCVFKCIFIYSINTYIRMHIKSYCYFNSPTLKFVFHVVFPVMLMSFSDFKRTFSVSLSSKVFLFSMLF